MAVFACCIPIFTLRALQYVPNAAKRSISLIVYREAFAVPTKSEQSEASSGVTGVREEGEGQRPEELWLRRPGTSFSTLSIARSFALQSMRESSLKNSKCTDRGFAPDHVLTPLGELTARTSPGSALWASSSPCSAVLISF